MIARLYKSGCRHLIYSSIATYSWFPFACDINGVTKNPYGIPDTPCNTSYEELKIVNKISVMPQYQCLEIQNGKKS